MVAGPAEGSGEEEEGIENGLWPPAHAGNQVEGGERGKVRKSRERFYSRHRCIAPDHCPFQAGLHGPRKTPPRQRPPADHCPSIDGAEVVHLANSHSK